MVTSQSGIKILKVIYVNNFFPQKEGSKFHPLYMKSLHISSMAQLQTRVRNTASLGRGLDNVDLYHNYSGTEASTENP